MFIFMFAASWRNKVEYINYLILLVINTTEERPHQNDFAKVFKR